MPINPDFVGRTYPSSEPYQLSREKIREFARAIGDTNPAYHDVAAAQALGYPDLVAPPTVPFVIATAALSAFIFDPDLGLDYGRVVHGEQSFDYTRPLCAGDEIVVDASIEAIDSAGRNEFLNFRADLRTTAGEPLCVTRSVIVSRGTGAAA